MSTNLLEGIILLAIVIALYVYYFFRGDRKKAVEALKKSGRVFFQNSLRLFAIFVIIGILDKFLSPKAVSQFLLKFKGFKGIIVGALTGSIMMGPAASSYPIAQYLLSHNAVYSLVTAFLFTWVAIGVVALPLEFKFLGKKFALLRNSFALISAILVAILIEAIL
jgi:uncharacterized membrane protein YraQ (UPF0718 family)